MAFGIFSKKRQTQEHLEPMNLKQSFEKLYSFFLEQKTDLLDQARMEFVKIAGPFDEDDEYFKNKLDDFRTWFLFFYVSDQEDFFILNQVSSMWPHVVERFKQVDFSVFEVVQVSEEEFSLKNLITKERFKIKDGLRAMTLCVGDLIQTGVFEVNNNSFETSLSFLYHPEESKRYIYKKVKELKKTKKDEQLFSKSKMNFLNDLLMKRYQVMKYKQVEVGKVYSDVPLFDRKDEDENR